MPSSPDWSRVLRGLSIVIHELAKHQTPELRTRFAQALKHSEELVGVARRLPGVVISAQSAASSASRRGNDIKRAVDAAFERGGLHDSSDASESSYRGDPSSNNTTDIAYDAALYSTRDELPLHSVRTESGPPFSTMATAPGLSRPPDNISLSTSAAAFNPPHYSTTNYYTPAAPADGTFTRTHPAAYLASVLPGEPVPTPRGLHVIAAERYTFAETNAAAVLESTTVIGSHSIHAEAVADAALTAASTEMLVSSSPLSSASSSQSMTDLLTPSRVLSDHGAEQEPPISGTAAAAAVAGKGPLISESAAVAVDAAAAATFVSPPTQPRRREFRERSVPASSIARAWGFGSLAASLALGAASDAVRAALRGAPAPQKPTPISSVAGSGATPLDSTSPSMAARSEASEVASDEATATVRAGDAATSSSASSGSGAHPHVISEAQAERLAEGLCRMRGAALKLGQMLSIADESVLPPAVAAVLERVRTQADVMPRRQLERVMAAELGADWRVRLGETSSGGGFVATPIAAASIGQVHYSVLADGRPVAVKVQYPGVGDSIHSDLDNLQRLLVFSDVLPKGLYLDAMVEVAREELSHECDYVREADAQERFKALVGDDPDFVVPSVIRELSTKRILVSTWLEGMAIDQVVERGYPQAVRDRIARKLLKLTLKELFEWRFMQTDPNWGNFFYEPATDRIGLLDFGAARSFPKSFVDDYLRLVWAAANNDEDTIHEVSLKLGFLTGLESAAMRKAHVDSGMIVGEPFRTNEPFDFRGAGITARIRRYGGVFAEQRLTPPPPEVYSLHRKLAGAFFICIRMGAVIRCRDLLEETYRDYVWGEEQHRSRDAAATESGHGAAVVSKGGYAAPAAASGAIA